MTIQTLSQHEVPSTQVARQLGVVEGTVHYHLRRAAAGAEDGRADKPFKAAALAAAIEDCWTLHADAARPGNLYELRELLVGPGRDSRAVYTVSGRLRRVLLASGIHAVTVTHQHTSPCESLFSNIAPPLSCTITECIS